MNALNTTNKQYQLLDSPLKPYLCSFAIENDQSDLIMELFSREVIIYSKTLKPFVPFQTFGNPKTLNCDRDSQGDVHYADMSVSIVRPKCIENLKTGLLPQKWMGKKIASIPSWGGCDVDYEWQMPMVEFWLKKNGYKKKK